MKDAKGHGSDKRGLHNSGIDGLPRQITEAQLATIRDYRQSRRSDMKALAESGRKDRSSGHVRSQFENDWVQKRVKELRTEHSASIQRQRLRGGR